MKPLNLIALLLFLAGATWALTRSEKVVRDIQVYYFKIISPTLTAGSALETKARKLLDETEHSKSLETKLSAIDGEIGRLRIIETQFDALKRESKELRHALDFKKPRTSMLSQLKSFVVIQRLGGKPWKLMRVKIAASVFNFQFFPMMAWSVSLIAHTSIAHPHFSSQMKMPSIRASRRHTRVRNSQRSTWQF